MIACSYIKRSLMLAVLCRRRHKAAFIAELNEFVRDSLRALKCLRNGVEYEKRVFAQTDGDSVCVFLAFFVAAPLIVLFYYAFTNGSGQFTLNNLKNFFGRAPIQWGRYVTVLYWR